MLQRSSRVRAIALVALLLPGASACTAPAPVHFTAAGWPEADELFRRDAHWVGGDGAYSVDLGGGRVLWLFGDSFVDPSGLRSRRRSTGARLVSNSLAIQTGYDPSAAHVEFFWSTAADGTPQAFFPDREYERFWPGDGVLLGDRLLLFLMRVHSVEGGLGFEVSGSEAVLVANAEAPPPEWVVKWLELPAVPPSRILGSAAVVCDEGFVYAYSSQEPGGHDIHLARWPEAAARAGDLRDIAWWSGARGFTDDAAASVPVLREAPTEFTVHRDPVSGELLAIEAHGFGSTDLVLRRAPQWQGPWSGLEMLYRPPEYGRERVLIYQGKAHPWLAGADLVLTYCTNSLALADVVHDDGLYFPRFVRLTRSATRPAERLAARESP